MRTFLLVEAEDAAIEAGLAAAPDVLVVDLAGTSPSSRGAAGRVEATVYARVSSLRSATIDDELARAMRLQADGIMLSGAQGLPDLEQLGSKLAVFEAEHGCEDGTIRIMTLIDTPEGVLSLPTMRPRPRLDAIAIDRAALAERLGCAPSAPAISQATGMTVLAAAACGVSAAMVLDGEHQRGLVAASEAGFGAVMLGI